MERLAVAAGLAPSARPNHTTPPVKELPLCLWKPHADKRMRHYIRSKECDCLEALIEKYRKDKNTNSTPPGATPLVKKTKAQQSDDNDQSGVVFGATFGNKMRATIFADLGADFNLMDETLASKLENVGALESIETLTPPRELTMAASLQFIK